METETRTSLVPDLADLISGLPQSVAGGLTGLPGAAPRQNRRLPERILVAAHQACDLGDLDVAAQLLSILETVVGQTRGPVDPARRRTMESLIAAHQRLWHLRHVGEGVGTQAATSSHGFHAPRDMASFQPTA